MRRVRAMFAKYGKKLMCWPEMMADPLGQLWAPGVNVDDTKAATTHGAKTVMAPAFTVHLDMKYAENVPSAGVGNDWTGHLDVKDMHDWDPLTAQDGVPADAVHGVDAPLFTELVHSPTDIQELAFP
ncbi:family 20 glycosylhydrolase [Kutzneria sp. CA-103260]|uniref:family 20 glycosylhydrolase n=1 Tax=Kutzneria sp. CA-103260 TaxID=2802641 RepID=UPI003FA52AAB